MFRFYKKVLLLTLVIIIIGFFPFLLWGKEYWLELSCSFFISFINMMVGYYLALNAINKSDPEFYKLVFGGMLIRMGILFGVSIYLILSNFVSATPYMLFLILFYVIHQWTEITSWLQELPIKKAQLS